MHEANICFERQYGFTQGLLYLCKLTALYHTHYTHTFQRYTEMPTEVVNKSRWIQSWFVIQGCVLIPLRMLMTRAIVEWGQFGRQDKQLLSSWATYHYQKLETLGLPTVEAGILTASTYDEVVIYVLLSDRSDCTCSTCQAQRCLNACFLVCMCNNSWSDFDFKVTWCSYS